MSNLAVQQAAHESHPPADHGRKMPSMKEELCEQGKSAHNSVRTPRLRA